MVDCIEYRDGYQYQLAKDVEFPLEYQPDAEKTVGPFVRFRTDGVLELRSGYAWDGPSGPTIDTRNFMRGSLVHDALYQLIREDELLPRKEWRHKADKELRRICRDDGMSRPRAWYVYHAVRKFANRSASPEKRKKLIRAPRRCTPTP